MEVKTAKPSVKKPRRTRRNKRIRKPQKTESDFDFEKKNREKETALATMREILEQRGYEVKYDDETIRAAKGNDIIHVFTEIEEKFDVKNFEACCKYLNNEGIKHGIVIYNTITNQSKKFLKNSTKLSKLSGNDTIQIEDFSKSELMFNITKHRLASKHELVTDETELLNTSDTFLSAKERVRKIASIKKNLSKILLTKPICRFYNFKKGDVIRITRRNGFITYRVVTGCFTKK